MELEDNWLEKRILRNKEETRKMAMTTIQSKWLLEEGFTCVIQKIHRPDLVNQCLVNVYNDNFLVTPFRPTWEVYSFFPIACNFTKHTIYVVNKEDILR